MKFLCKNCYALESPCNCFCTHFLYLSLEHRRWGEKRLKSTLDATPPYVNTDLMGVTNYSRNCFYTSPCIHAWNILLSSFPCIPCAKKMYFFKNVSMKTFIAFIGVNNKIEVSSEWGGMVQSYLVKFHQQCDPQLKILAPPGNGVCDRNALKYNIGIGL